MGEQEFEHYDSIGLKQSTLWLRHVLHRGCPGMQTIYSLLIGLWLIASYCADRDL